MVRSSIADARGTLQLGYDNDSGSEKQDRETEKISLRRQTRYVFTTLFVLISNSINTSICSMDNLSLRNIIHSKEKDTPPASSSSGFSSAGTTDPDTARSPHHHHHHRLTSTVSVDEDTTKRKTSFATLPNTTTWQQQSINYHQSDNSGKQINISPFFNCACLYECS